MKAYRVNLIGTKDHYLVTEKQKQALDQMLQSKSNSIVTIGGDTIRVNSIKSITYTNVDAESCPDYFYEAAKVTETVQKIPQHRKLPKEWIILDTNGKILSDRASLHAEREVIRAMANANPEGKYWVANCHYREGADGGKEYLTRLEQIPEVTEKQVLVDEVDAPIVQIYHYGESLIDTQTGKIRGDR